MTPERGAQEVLRPLPEDRRGVIEMPADRGLSEPEAREQRTRFGPNDIIERRDRAWREIASDTARDPMLWFLLGTGGVYLLLSDFAEAIVLLASLVPLVAMDAVLHRRTRASTRGLHSRLAATATVIRDGHEREIPVDEVVPGDLARVAPGEPFPADGLVVAGEEIQADESALTGESFPVRKRPLDAASWTRPRLAFALGHWGFAGTRLLTGTAWLRVALTGRDTLYGEIVRSAQLGAHAHTPLQRSVARLVRALLIAAALLCAALASVRLYQGFGAVDALVSAVTLAVAALPEEFPVVLVMFLGVGVYRLARRRALVRRSVSVENIGRVTCVCSDKTGTLTLGTLQLTHRLPAPSATPEDLLRVAALASRAETGDPLDVAILAAAKTAAPAPTVVATFPFTEDRRRETAVVRRDGAPLLAAAKGAPEDVLALCRMEADERASWTLRVSELAADGHKVLACASCELSDASWSGREPDRDLRFEGLLAFEDPVRAGVAGSVRQCVDAGIRVVMVTGDHAATAGAVAREIGLCAGAARVATGEEIEDLIARDRHALDHVDVVARAFPAQKLALVRTLQAAGEIVAVTGDGVNDVPALQVADVGIAMGERGTRSAREAAAIVLLDDDFRTIVGAIAEGRQLFRNLQNSFRYLLAIHIPLVLTAALIPLAGYPLLYLPIHIVWLELIIHPSALLAFQDLAPRGGLARLERHRGGAFFVPREWARIAVTGGLLTALLVGGYALNASAGVEHARASALAALFIASAVATALLSGLRTRAARIVSVTSLVAGVAGIQVPALAAHLHLVPLHRPDWAIAALGAIAACAPLAPGLRRSVRRKATAPHPS